MNSRWRELLSALKTCTASRDLVKGRSLHAQVIETGSFNIYVANSLMKMYASCGSLVDAQNIFERMPCHSAVSWNVLILGFAENEEEKVALDLFENMSCERSELSYVAALKACTCLAAKEEGQRVCGKMVKVKSLETGMGIHSQVTRSGFSSEVFVATSLVNMYAKCGSLWDARMVFDRMQSNAVALTALLMGYVENGEAELGLDLFWGVRLQQVCEMKALTYVAALKACTSLAEAEGKKHKGMRILETGIAIHKEATKSGFDSDMFVACTLISMYAKCASMVDARRVFDKMASHNVVAWSALILGYAENREEEEALQFFGTMQSQGCAPNSSTFVAALKACTSLAEVATGEKLECLERGMAIHSHAAKLGFELDLFVASTLVSMYAKCGSMADARRVFDRMKFRNLVSWNALMLGYVENNEEELAVDLFWSMQSQGCCCVPDARTFVAALKACSILALHEERKKVEGKLLKEKALEQGRAIHSLAKASGCDTDIFVVSTLVDMYANCGDPDEARKIFDRIPHPDVVSWTALILGYVENGEAETALELFSQMQPRGCIPDARTFVAVLKACGGAASLEAGRKAHAAISAAGLDNDDVLLHCLVDVYAKCGSMVTAQQVFDSVPSRNVDLMTWTALLAGYSRQGDTQRVFDLFYGMMEEGLCPDGTTLLCVLTACSHSGLVNKGKEIFEAMRSKKYGDTVPGVEHYRCMIDILGRANQLNDAVAMVASMPFEADVMTWMIVLGACSKWKNVEVGKLAFEALQKLDFRDSAVYSLMRNIYGSTQS